MAGLRESVELPLRRLAMRRRRKAQIKSFAGPAMFGLGSLIGPLLGIWLMTGKGGLIMVLLS
jgi:hypothetical protein